MKLGVDLDLPQGNRIIENRLADNSFIDLNKQYKVVTNEFLAKGGDGYISLMKGENIRYAGDIKEFFNFALRNEKTINYRADGRLSVGYMRLAS